jgi:hypothetical protein
MKIEGITQATKALHQNPIESKDKKKVLPAEDKAGQKEA